MIEWVYLLISMPVLAGDPGRITSMRMIDQTACLKQAMTTFQADLQSGNALMQPLCMPANSASAFIAASNCHDPEHHLNPDRIDVSCEGIVKGPK
jgi:hypothetical protein